MKAAIYVCWVEFQGSLRYLNIDYPLLFPRASYQLGI